MKKTEFAAMMKRKIHFHQNASDKRHHLTKVRKCFREVCKAEWISNRFWAEFRWLYKVHAIRKHIVDWHYHKFPKPKFWRKKKNTKKNRSDKKKIYLKEKRGNGH